MSVSLSVLIPALNEAANIEAAVRGVLGTVDRIGLDAEILVLTCVDRNGASDGTIDIVRRLATAEPRIRPVHSERYQLLGEKFRQGVLLAAKTYLVMIPGDNENHPSSFEDTFRRIGQVDMILCYATNPEARPWQRRLLSRAYTSIVNGLFGQRVTYYNGMNVYRTADVQRALPRSDSFALGAETVLRLLHRGKTYIEVPVRLQARHGRSKALRLDNVARVGADIIKLRWSIGRE